MSFSGPARVIPAPLLCHPAANLAGSPPVPLSHHHHQQQQGEHGKWHDSQHHQKHPPFASRARNRADDLLRAMEATNVLFHMAAMMDA